MEGHFTIRMSSQPDLLCVARAVVETAAKAIGFSEVQCNEVAMVINEALTNVIRHAYGGRTDQPISLRVEPCRQKGRDGIQIIQWDTLCRNGMSAQCKFEKQNDNFRFCKFGKRQFFTTR